jgi:predicted nucleotidyltransferase
MIDLTRVDERTFDLVTPVVEQLTAQVDVDPDRILLVGAGCRDVLHAAFGHTFPARATTDTDLGIAVSNWTVSENIEDRFSRIGTSGIRYRIAGDVAAVRLLGMDVAAQLSPAHRDDLAQRWAAQDLTGLARDFTLPAGGPQSPNFARRRAVIAQLRLTA